MKDKYTIESKVEDYERNINIERKLKNKKEIIEKLIEKLKKEKEKLINEICSMQKEIEELSIDLLLMDYVNEDDMNKNNYSTVISTTQPSSIRGNKKKEIDDQKLNKMFEMNKKNKKKEEKEEEINKVINERDKNRSKIDKLNNEIEKLKEEFKKIKNYLINHYHLLLKQGKDTRHEGLCWIIKEILLFGSTVKLSHLPCFLDEKCITFLFNLSHLSIKLNKIYEEKKVRKFSLKSLRETKSQDLSKKVTFKTSLNKLTPMNIDRNGIRNQNLFTNNSSSKFDLSLKKDFTFFPIEEHFTMKTIEEFIYQSGSIDQDIIEVFENINEIEQIETFIKNSINDLKRKEMDRIFKEYARNDYERRYNVDKTVVISALIGEDQKNQELTRQLREQKNYENKLSICKLFNPSEKTELKGDKFKTNSLYKGILSV